MPDRAVSAIGAVLISVALTVGCSRFASEKLITLRFTPKENVTANVPASEGLSAYSSFKEENYNEEISDALKRTYANLVGDAGFQKAWTGQTVSSERTPTLLELKTKILEMMKAGFSDDTIEAYARRTRVSRAPSVEELVEWKKAGIGERVIKAVLEQKP